MTDFSSKLKQNDPRLESWPNEFFWRIFERSVNEIYVFDADTLKFLHVNECARLNLGYSMSELADMTPVDVKPEFDLKSFRELIAPLRKRTDALVFETIHLRKDRSRYPVEVHLQYMRVNDMSVFAAILLDITTQKIAETELRHADNLLDHRVQERTHTLQLLNDRLEERERDLEQVFDAAPDAMLLVNQEGEIERVNARSEQLFGYSKAEMRGANVEMLMPENVRSDHVRHREKFSKRPRVREMGVNLDLCGRRKDGSEFPIDVNLSPIEFRGRRLVAAAIRDFTERQAIQEALRSAKEESDRATASKSRFLATASHDLRQPLQSLGLYLSVLARRTEDPKSLEVTTKMRRSLDVMGDMLDALLDISKFESGAIVPELCNIEVQELFDKIACDNAPVATKKGLAFDVERSPVVIHSDPALLQRIVENFVTNAIRYTETGRVVIACRVDGDEAVLEVSDTGIGIPDDSLDVIFDEYYQLENKVRDRKHGLGIGLAIVKHVAQLLGHELQVESTPGRGSTFGVRVPITSATNVEKNLPDNGVVEREAVSATVLLIDDDEAIIDATTLLLESEGFDVTAARNGDEALQHCRGGVRPDIVVSDYRLPGLTGIEVIRRLRDLVNEDLPAILMTGDTATRNITDANLTKCAVLHKPVDTERLVDLIHESA